METVSVCYKATSSRKAVIEVNAADVSPNVHRMIVWSILNPDDAVILVACHDEILNRFKEVEDVKS